MIKIHQSSLYLTILIIMPGIHLNQWLQISNTTIITNSPAIIITKAFLLIFLKEQVKMDTKLVCFLQIDPITPVGQSRSACILDGLFIPT